MVEGRLHQGSRLIARVAVEERRCDRAAVRRRCVWRCRCPTWSTPAGDLRRSTSRARRGADGRGCSDLVDVRRPTPPGGSFPAGRRPARRSGGDFRTGVTSSSLSMAMRTTPAPALRSCSHWATVASTSRVLVAHMLCTTSGAGPPMRMLRRRSSEWGGGRSGNHGAATVRKRCGGTSVVEWDRPRAGRRPGPPVTRAARYVAWRASRRPARGPVPLLTV
jgi:hypothetical protein